MAWANILRAVRQPQIHYCHYWLKVRLFFVCWANNSISHLVRFVWVSDHNPGDEFFSGACVDSTTLSREMNNDHTFY